MTVKELAVALHRGERVYGTCITSTSPKWPAMAVAAGLDFVFLDTEHIPIDRAQLAWMCAAYGAAGLPPVVRIPSPDPYAACMALDGGAAGVVAPYIETAAQVRDLRGAVKLRPLKGRRMRDAVETGEPLEPKLADYLANWNAGRLMIVNIESVPALEALDEILAVPDIDALLIGPHDLSLNLGIPEEYDHPRFNEAVSLIIRKAREKHVGVGLHYSFGIANEIRWAQEGANFIVHSTDMFLVREALAADLARFREALGEQARSLGGGDGGGADVV